MSSSHKHKATTHTYTTHNLNPAPDHNPTKRVHVGLQWTENKDRQVRDETIKYTRDSQEDRPTAAASLETPYHRQW